MVSQDTLDLLDRHVRATGVKKGYLIEMALRHHLQALQEIPTEFVIPPVLTVSRRSGERILERLTSSEAPPPALRDLMSGDGD